MEGHLRANMLWDSIVRYKTERGALGSKTGYPRLCHTTWLMHTWRASARTAADGQPPARGVHRRNRGTEDLHPARTRHACGHWANPQPRCTLKLTVMRRKPRPRRRRATLPVPKLTPRARAETCVVQAPPPRRDLCRPSGADVRTAQTVACAHGADRPPSEPSAKSTLPYPK